MNPSARLARRVREERIRAGWSSRELASRAGLSHVTSAAVERGREVRASTLDALLRALPGLRVEELFGDEAAVPARESEWHRLAGLFGFRAALVELEARVSGDGLISCDWRVSGLRATRGRLLDPERLVAVLGAALQGPATRLAFDLAGKVAAGSRAWRSLSSSFIASGVEHEMRLLRDASGGHAAFARRDTGSGVPVEEALAEQSPHGRPFHRGACAWIDLPVERLVLRARFSAAPPRFARIIAWPATLATSPGEDVNAWSRLYPHAPGHVEVTDGVAELSVSLPPLGTCFALAWDQSASPRRRMRPSPVAVRPLKRRAVGEALREAREQAGMSRREVAREMGVSAASIVEAERGRDSRLDLLARAMTAIPGLCSTELFPPREALEEPDIESIRERQALLHGVRTDAERSIVRIAANGDVAVETRREGLRPIDPLSRRELRLRIGPTRGPQTASRWVVESISARGGEAEATVRVVGRGGGPTVHELKFLASGHRRPITHVRRMTVHGQIAMRPDSPGLTRDASGRRAEAVYVEPALPAGRAVLELRFPRGYWPDEIRASAVPRCSGPSFEPEDLAPLVHPGGWQLDVDRARRRVVLEVQRPLVGLRYQVLWFMDGPAR